MWWLLASIFLPVRIIFENSSSLQAGAEFASLQCKKVMVVTDKGIVDSGMLDAIVQSLEDSGIAAVTFDQVIPDPNLACVEAANELYMQQQCDGILAVGGGSSIDTAKAAAILATNPKPLFDLAGVDKIEHPLPPLIAIPTTCGTGSEVTNVAVVTDEHHFKTPFVSIHIIPKVAILDPTLLASLPPSLVSATGMDALTHAIESLTNKVQNWYSEATAVQAIRMIGSSIRQATTSGNNSALGDMLYASTLAGIAFTFTRLGLVHAMSHPVSGFANVPHGLANAVLLPYVTAFNLVSNPEVHAVVARELGVGEHGNALKTAAAGVEEIAGINHQIGIPKSFKDLGVSEQCIPQMIEDTFKSGNVAINSRRVTKNDVEKIYRAAFDGEDPLKFVK
jgi:alcohol dehydrogenase class IV